MARIIVAIELSNGGRLQATCRTGDCTWIGGRHVVKVGAEDDACNHRMWHRARQTAPIEPEASG